MNTMNTFTTLAKVLHNTKDVPTRMKLTKELEALLPKIDNVEFVKEATALIFYEDTTTTALIFDNARKNK